MAAVRGEKTLADSEGEAGDAAPEVSHLSSRPSGETYWHCAGAYRGRTVPTAGELRPCDVAVLMVAEAHAHSIVPIDPVGGAVPLGTFGAKTRVLPPTSGTFPEYAMVI